MSGNTDAPGLTRRSFLKTTAAVAGTAALVGSFGCTSIGTSGRAAATIDEERIIRGSCKSNCGGSCSIKIKVRDEKIVQTSMFEMPDPVYNRICPRGFTHLQRTYDPDRIKYPMRRVGERGSGEWERITWDEALEEIAGKWKQYQQEYGTQSIMFSNASGNIESLSGTVAIRLSMRMGASILENCDDIADMYWSTKTLGLSEYWSGNEYADFANAKCVLLWGANATESNVQQWHFFAEAQENGAKLICIDPNYTVTASKCDIHVPIKPTTDAALAMAMMNIVVRDNLIDEDFLKNSSVAPFLVKEGSGTYLRLSDIGREPLVGPVNPRTGEPTINDAIVVMGEDGSVGLPEEIGNPTIRGTYAVNGINVTTAYDLLVAKVNEYPVEKVSEISEIPVETIEEITRIYATDKPSTIFAYYGIDRYYNGHTSVFAAMCLAMLTGNVGKPGASAGLAYADAFGSVVLNKMPIMLAEPYAWGKVPVTWLPDVMEKNDYFGREITVKSLYVNRGNPLGAFPERQKLLAAMMKMELIVVSDFHMSDTAQYADILLPCSYWYETNDLYYFFIPYMTLQDKAIEPLYESKGDFDTTLALAKAMGLQDDFQYTEEGVVKVLLDKDYLRDQGITYERLKEEKIVRCVKAGPSGRFIHGEGGVFPTETGRAQFYLESPTPTSNWGQEIDVENEHLPRYMPPNEAWSGSELFPKYPLIYFQEHKKWRLHTQFTSVPWLREIDTEPLVYLNPGDAASRDIQDGDIVKVFNDRGYVTIKAAINNGLHQGMVNIPHGWERGQYIDGHYQDLTSRTTNPICVNNAFYDNLVEVEKV